MFKAGHQKCVVAVASLLMIGGCSTETPKIESYSVPLRVHAGTNLNQGKYKQPLAQVIKIYHLRAVERFEQTPFDDFLSTNEEEQALGSDLLDSREVLLVPGQHFETVEDLDADAKYIGIVAFFRQPAPQRWRLAYSTKDSQATGITLGIHACALSSTTGALVSKISSAANTLISVNCGEPDGS
jgi:type VI secretion system protein VasD